MLHSKIKIREEGEQNGTQLKYRIIIQPELTEILPYHPGSPLVLREENVMNTNKSEVQNLELNNSDCTSALLEAALKYARRGWAIFPLHYARHGECSCTKADCQDPGKHPMFHLGDLQHGLLDATKDESLIKKWWARWPDANIGIATGKVSGFIVLDVDLHPGCDGNETLEDLGAQNGRLPDTVESITGSGGRHILFAHPGYEVRNKTGFAAGLDVRADGGYIVAPPSMHGSGKEYEWEASSNPDDVPLAEIPEWLLKMITDKPPAETDKHAASDDEVILKGSRNSSLASIAGKLRRSGLLQDAIEAALLKVNETQCNPPLSQAEVKKIAQSISRYKPAENAGEKSQSQKTSQELNLTDLGNAERFAMYCGNNVRHCKESGTWYIFNGSRWEEDWKGQIIQFAKQTVRAIYKEASQIQDDTKRIALVKHAASSEALSRINAMVTLAAAEPPIPMELNSFDTDLFLLNCANGTIDLRTGELKPHTRTDLIRKMSSVQFDASAGCPKWKAFLDEIMEGNSQLVAFLQRAVGYCLTGDVSEQVVVMLYGTGANGKTTFIEIVRSLLGDYAQHANVSMFLSKKHDGIPNDVAQLKGARFVSASEIENGRRLSEATIKQMTGEVRIKARFLHKEFFEFDATFKIFIATNHKPVIVGTDEGIWRKIRLIPFSVRILEAQRDRALLNRLREELPGILTWAVQGCLDWQANGLGYPTEVRNATAEYRGEMDVLSNFIEECCIVEEGPRTDPGALYDAYKHYCGEYGEYQMNQRFFSQRLVEKGFVKKRSAKNGGFEWHGIDIRI